MMEPVLTYELAKDDVDGWRVEAQGDDGEMYCVLFTGPVAQQRAEEYLQWRTMGEAEVLGRSTAPYCTVPFCRHPAISHIGGQGCLDCPCSGFSR